MTVRHVVSWQLTASDAQVKAEQGAQVCALLEGLVGVVGDIRSLQVGTDLAGGGNWDVVLIADFDDLDAVARYQAHPEHQKVGGYIRSVVAARSCVDIRL